MLSLKKSLKDANSDRSLTFCHANLCLTYSWVKCSSGLFAAPDWEHVSCHSVRDFKLLKSGQRGEEVGGRQSSSRVFPDQRLLSPADVPPTDIGVKQKIWPGLKLSNSHNDRALRGYMKKGDPRWRGKTSLCYVNRSPHHLTTYMGPASLNDIVDLTVGWGQRVVAVLVSHFGTASTFPALVLTTAEEHAKYVVDTLSDHVLRSLRSPVHKLHEEALEREITEAFPNLCSLSAAADATDDTGDVDMQCLDADADSDDGDNGCPDD